MKPLPGQRRGPPITLEMQLICKCCGQPYYPNKSWEDRYRAVVFGAEQFAICPICTQSPSTEALDRPVYRRRCLREVRRLEVLYEKAKRKKERIVPK